MGTKIITLALVATVIGLIVAVPVTPVFILLRKIFYVPFIRKRLVDQALAQGHVVQAKLIRAQDQYLEDKQVGRIASQYREGLYHYEYNGKSYRYRYSTPGSMPQELTLYFQKRPRRACLAEELGVRESNWLGHYVGISLLVALVSFCILWREGVL